MKTLITTIISLIYFQNIFSQSSPVLFPGFPIILDSVDFTYNNGPIVADFNNDGENEILVGVNLESSIGKVILVDNHGNLFDNFPKYVSCFSSYIWIAAGDVDGNGNIDVVVKSDSLYVFDFTGNSLPGFPKYIPISPNDLGDKISLYDFDNDKNLEIILAKKNVITVINHNGIIRDGWPKQINLNGGDTYTSYLSVGDLNGDNIAEIIVPCSNVTPPPHIDSNKIYIFEPDGSEYTYSQVVSDSGYDFDVWNYPIIFENNNQTYFSISSNYSPNLMPNSYKARFTTYNSSGQTITRNYLTPYLSVESLTMGKLDTSDPFFLCGDLYYTYGFKGDGSSLPGFPLFLSSYQYRNHNIGNLSDKACFISTETRDTLGGNGLRGYLKAWDVIGIQLPWSPLRPLGIPGTAPSFADLNNDGQAELIATSNFILDNDDGCALYVWTLPGVSYSTDNFPWPMWGHDRYRTNQFGFIPPDDPVGIQPNSTNIPEKFLLYQNFPNPFNPSTVIKFDIKNSSNVKLLIFNSLGKEIETLINETLRPGSYSRIFNGSNYSSGIYFYRLTSDNYTESKKMVLVR